MKSKAQLFFDLPKNWEDIVSDILSEGGCDIDAYTALNLTAKEHKVLLEVEQYIDHFTNCLALSERWWINKAREALLDREYDETFIDDDGKEVKRTYKPDKFDTKLFEKIMNRMFGWDKKVDKNKEDNGKNNQGRKDAEKLLNKHKIRKIK